MSWGLRKKKNRLNKKKLPRFTSAGNQHALHSENTGLHITHQKPRDNYSVRNSMCFLISQLLQIFSLYYEAFMERGYANSRKRYFLLKVSSR